MTRVVSPGYPHRNKKKKKKDSLSLINSMLNDEIKKIGIKNIKKDNGNLG